MFTTNLKFKLRFKIRKKNRIKKKRKWVDWLLGPVFLAGPICAVAPPAHSCLYQLPHGPHAPAPAHHATLRTDRLTPRARTSGWIIFNNPPSFARVWRVDRATDGWGPLGQSCHDPHRPDLADLR
jgi:hypothetical protein